MRREETRGRRYIGVFVYRHPDQRLFYEVSAAHCQWSDAWGNPKRGCGKVKGMVLVAGVVVAEELSREQRRELVDPLIENASPLSLLDEEMLEEVG